MNNVVLIGRLVRDPEVRYTESQMAICRFTLAVNREKRRENEQQADFINMIAFAKTAENIEKYIFRGSQIAVQGRIQTGSYVNKEGTKVYTTEVVVNTVQFLNTKKESEITPSDFEKIEDEEIPF